jgi:hypothetical protein
MKGATLALDFPNGGQPTAKLMNRLEQIVVEAEGRLYAAKDSFMTQGTFRRGYSEFDRFMTLRDPVFTSAFARRVGLA